MGAKLILDTLMNVFSKAKNNIVSALVIVCGILIFITLQTCNSNSKLKAENERQAMLNKQNTYAILDSIHLVKDKLGNIEADKAAYVANIKDLKELNKSLYSKVKAVEGNVISIINSKVTGKMPPMTADNYLINYPDSITHGLRFKYQYRDSGLVSNISGISKFKAINGKLFKDSTTIDENNISLDITYGIKEDNKQYIIFAKSSSKYVTFNQLDGALMITKNNPTCPAPKIKKWSVGPYFGYAFGFGTKKLDFGFGLGVQYSLIRF